MILYAGDWIEYQQKLARNKTQTLSGTIVQVTDKLIVVDVGNYRETIYRSDIGNSVHIMARREGGYDVQTILSPTR